MQFSLQGHTAVQMSQQSKQNIYEVSLGNLPANQEAEIKITYIRMLQQTGNAIEYIHTATWVPPYYSWHDGLYQVGSECTSLTGHHGIQELTLVFNLTNTHCSMRVLQSCLGSSWVENGLFHLSCTEDSWVLKCPNGNLWLEETDPLNSSLPEHTLHLMSWYVGVCIHGNIRYTISNGSHCHASVLCDFKLNWAWIHQPSWSRSELKINEVLHAGC